MNKLIVEPVDIGKVVRVVRKGMKLTQMDAAALCKVGTRFLSDLENGKQRLQLGKMLQVLKGFGLVLVIERKGLPS